MRRLNLIAMLCLLAVITQAQYTFKAKITDNATFKAVPGAVAYVKNEIRAVADDKGFITVTSIPEGEFEISFSVDGYFTKSVVHNFPLAYPDFVHKIELKAIETAPIPDMGFSTRSNKPVDEIPTRIEVLNSEFLARQAHLSNGDIASVLDQETGIRIQQTSAMSNNVGIRIHGLNGRYTQVLRDGFPLYSGYSGELSALQVTPLDLHQIEIIKGSSSTLYGNGGVSGTINLISKTPKNKNLTIMMKGTSALGLDVSGFYSQKFKKIGVTFFAARNANKAYDPAGISLTAIPEYERYTFNPSISFYLSDKTQLNISANSTFEDRVGGDTKYIRGEGDSTHSFFQKDLTDRVSSQMVLTHKLNNKSKLTFKNSFGFFNKQTEMEAYQFSGRQLTSFSEVSWQHQIKKLEWTLGTSAQTDNFNEDQNESSLARDYNNYIIGAFAQNIWNATKWFSLETGMRIDYHSNYGAIPLPRFSALFALTPKLSARVGGGLGYRAPTIFTYEAELLRYKNVQPIDANQLDLERSMSGSFDVNYKTKAFKNDGLFSINQLFFYTKIYNPIELVEQTDGSYQYIKEDGYYDSKGTETNVSLNYKELSFGLGYTFTYAKQRFNANTNDVPLSPNHRMTGTFMYEINKEVRVGLEVLFTGKQRLYDQTPVAEYWMLNVMAEKMWNHFSIFVNVENILNVRQTKYEKLYSGTLSNPDFNTIYAPINGVVANIGFKVKL